MEHLTEMVASLARLEERQEHIIEKIDSFSLVIKRVDSLETTRDKQTGAAKIMAVGLTILMATLGWLRWWG